MTTLPRRLFPISLTLVASLACSSSSSDGDNNGTKTWSGDYGWTCTSGQNCQDVFDITLAANSTVTIQVSNVSSGSVAQLALYAPGVALGATNLLTTSNKELRCNAGTGCSDFTGGEAVSGFSISTAGTYRLAVTRDWGSSCGGTGTYHVAVTSSKTVQFVAQTKEDAVSAADGFECHQ